MIRRSFLQSLAFGCSLSLTGIACGGGGGGGSSYTPPPPPTPPPNHVWAGGSYNTFNPQNLTVTVGTTVTWDFIGGSHNVTSGTPGSPDGKFNSGAPQTSGTFTYQFTAAGSYPYYCSVHGAMMTGTITVN